LSEHGKYGPPKGMRDWSPRETLMRQELMARIGALYQLYGFQPIDTPALENLEVLFGKGGGENEKLLFKVLKRGDEFEKWLSGTLGSGGVRPEDGGEKPGLTGPADMGLRFDLTVPLARYVASHSADLPRVFRVYHIGPVWRADRPQKGRFREFYQCDIDVVGGESIHHEVEILTASERALNSLGLGKIRLRLSDKRFLPILLGGLGVEAGKAPNVSLALDKLDKKALPDVLAEIQEALGEGPVAHRVMDFVAECQGNRVDLKMLENFKLPEEHDGVTLTRVIQNLRDIVVEMRKINPVTSIHFDPLLVRGMDYYTGPVFEAGLEGVSYSIGGGGRYDKLIGRFLGKEMPAVGFSIGFERILAALQEKEPKGSMAKARRVFLINAGQSATDIHLTAEKLREGGIAVETYFVDADFGRQMKMAEALGIEFAVKEFSPLDGTYLVRKLSERRDLSVNLTELKNLLLE